VQSIVQQLEEYTASVLHEKIYLHTDRSFYLTGETLWYSIYYTDAIRHQPLNMSKVAYLEIVDADNVPALQVKSALAEGRGHGSVFLPATIASGRYRLRAYTHWMQNFAPELYFEKEITIVNPFNKLAPLNVADSGTAAIQFYPEGGRLVAGLESRVAFEAEVQESRQHMLLNDLGDTVVHTTDSSQWHEGLFYFTPAYDRRYSLLSIGADSSVSIAELPGIHSSGMVMHVQDLGPQLRVSLQGTADLVGRAVHLIGHCRQQVHTAITGALQEDKLVFTIDKAQLGDGVNHFTVFDSQQQPVCERLYFRFPKEQLTFAMVPDQAQYGKREEINIRVRSLRSDGSVVPYHASAAVYRIDSLAQERPDDIMTYFYLASDLGSGVQVPHDFWEKKDERAADRLMLTRGWRRFSWVEVVDNEEKLLSYIPEYRNHIIKGLITNREKQTPVADVITYLSTPGKNVRLYGSRSNEAGQVLFEVRDFYGPKELVLQTQDSTKSITVLSPFSEQHVARALSPLDLTSDAAGPLLNRSVQMQVQNAYATQDQRSFVVPEVDSTTFYGTPDQRYLLDDFTRFTVMEEVMREYVSGVLVRRSQGQFRFRLMDMPNRAIFEENPMVLLDGVPVFDINKIMALDPLNVERIDVMTTQYFIGPLSFKGLVSYTTYSGNLAGHRIDPRSVLVEYEGLQLRREFHEPDHSVAGAQHQRMPDFRNLLHWEPTLQTNESGEAVLQFYSSDVPGTYRVVVQGLAGGLAGFSTVLFEVSDTDLSMK
jgi:hypothetical protein